MIFSICVNVLFVVNGYNSVHINTLKQYMTEQRFSFFFFSFQSLLYKTLKILKLRVVLYLKEENFDCKYVIWKKYWQIISFFWYIEVNKVMNSQKCWKRVKTQILPLIHQAIFINFLDTVRDTCLRWVHICSSKNLVCEAALCLFQDQSMFSEDKWTNKVC